MGDQETMEFVRKLEKEWIVSQLQVTKKAFLSLVVFLRKARDKGATKGMDFKLLIAYARTCETGFPGTLATIRMIPSKWKIHTSINLSEGYFHIPMCGILSSLFAFECQSKKFKYKCLPHGWTSSASAFHSRMCNMLVNTQAVVYVDDLLVGGRTQAKHNRNFSDVLSRLNQAGMYVNREKMQLNKTHVLFLRYDVGGGAFGLNSYVETQKKGSLLFHQEVR